MSEGEGAVTIDVDREACMGARICTRRAPGVFGVGDDGKAIVLDSGGDRLPSILTAARDCPRFAIRVERGGVRLD